MAANYTRQIEFKVKDTEIRRATDRIVSSLKKIEDSLGRIERGGFNKLGRDATKAGTRIDKLRTKVAGFEKLAQGMLRTGQGRRATFLGFLGLGATFNELDRSVASVGAKITNLSRAFNPFSKNVEIATAKAGVFSTKLHALTAFAAGHPVAVGAMAVAYMAFGDVMEKIARKAIPSVLMGIDALGKKALIATGLWKGLNEEVIRFNKGSVLRGVHRSRAGRAGSGYGAWSAQAGEYNPYNLHPGHLRSGVHAASGVGFDNVSERLQFGLTSAQAGRGDMYMRGGAYGPMPASPYRLDSQYDIATQKAIARHAKKHLPKIDKSTAKAAAILSQQAASATFSGVPQGGFSAPTIPGARKGRNIFNQLGFGANASRTGIFASSQGMAGRLKGGLGSAAIGGAFPALFGQGPMAAAGGALGGLGGGMLGGMFGFGGSLAGTLIGAKIQEVSDFRKEMDQLNTAILATGGSSVFTSKDITRLSQTLGVTKKEALQAAKSFSQFDAAARVALTNVYGGEATFDMLAGFKDSQSVLNNILSLSKELSAVQAKQVLQVLRERGHKEAIALATEMIEKKQAAITSKNAKKNNNLSWLEWIGVTGGGQVNMELYEQLKGEKQLENIANAEKELALAREKLDVERALRQEIEKNAYLAQTRDELNKLLDPMYQLKRTAETVGDAFSESFKGLIKGSMSAQQALANLFQRTADMFLDMAAKMIAEQIKMKILGIGFNFFGLGGSSSMSQGGYYNPNTGVGQAGPNYGLADGGTARGGESYIVGERGPELFVPRTTGTVVPNHELGGGSNMVINVDASGSSVEGDDDRSRQLGELIGAAVQSEIIRQQRPGGTLY